MKTKIISSLILLKFVNATTTLHATLHATKRNVLKVLAMFYEPIGVLQLFLINLKSFFQQQKMTNQNPDNPLEHIELQGFSDASLQNYGTCVYLHLIYF